MEAGRARARPLRFDSRRRPEGGHSRRARARRREDGPRPLAGTTAGSGAATRGRRHRGGRRGPSGTHARQHGAVPPRYPPADSRAGPGGRGPHLPRARLLNARSLAHTLAQPSAGWARAPPPPPGRCLRSRPGTERHGAPPLPSPAAPARRPRRPPAPAPPAAPAPVAAGLNATPRLTPAGGWKWLGTRDGRGRAAGGDSAGGPLGGRRNGSGQGRG